MYPGWSHQETSRHYHPPTYNSKHPREQPSSYNRPPSVNYPPHPLEPRPDLQSSFSEPSVLSRSRDSYSYHHDNNAPEYRSANQSLPGVKDILNPVSFSNGPNSYGDAWNAPRRPSSNHRESDSYHVPQGIHPPMVLHPPMNIVPLFQSQTNGHYKVHGTAGNAISPTNVSSANVYSEANRSYQDSYPSRQTHGPVGPVSANGSTDGYRTTGPDKSQHRAQTQPQYRQSRANQVAAGAENHGEYLGIEEIAGDGQYHVYADGHRIPTQVDGEQVNPAWGLTKANKPRKRLALACLDCREKKIKCEPGHNSCIQCEKAMRPCRRAPEKYQQPETPSNAMWVSGQIRRGTNGPDITPTTYRSIEPDVLSKRRSRGYPSSPPGSNKRLRSNSPPGGETHSTDRSTQKESASPPGAGQRNASDASSQDILILENDPYVVDRQVTRHLLDLYFVHINNATLRIFPRNHFVHWVETSTNKSQRELMVLYTMLAAASIFADDHLTGFGKQCVQVAGEAIASEGGKFSLAAAQTKIFLAFYHFSKGSNGLALDFAGSAIRIVTNLNLNTEDHSSPDMIQLDKQRLEFGFSPLQLEECSRRTFWSCFIQDRYTGSSTCAINPQDIFRRLPCTDDMYERSVVSNAPYFANDTINEDTTIDASSPLSPMAWLLLVANIWGDVGDFCFRASYRSDSNYRQSYESFYSQTQARLQDWLSRLPEYLQYNEANLNRSIQECHVGIFISMHAVYHLSIIKMNRYMRHGVLSDLVSRNIRAANQAGHRVLQMMTTLHLANRQITSPIDGQPAVCTFSTHFPGYVILSAIDIVSAGGLDSNLSTTLEEIEGALGILNELSQHWNSAKEQLQSCRKRFYQLKNVTSRPGGAKSGCWVGRKWGIKGHLEQEYERRNDCIYGLSVDPEAEADEASMRYFDAFNED